MCPCSLSLSLLVSDSCCFCLLERGSVFDEPSPLLSSSSFFFSLSLVFVPAPNLYFGCCGLVRWPMAFIWTCVRCQNCCFSSSSSSCSSPYSLHSCSASLAFQASPLCEMRRTARTLSNVKIVFRRRRPEFAFSPIEHKRKHCQNRKHIRWRMEKQITNDRMSFTPSARNKCDRALSQINLISQRNSQLCDIFGSQRRATVKNGNAFGENDFRCSLCTRRWWITDDGSLVKFN